MKLKKITKRIIAVVLSISMGLTVLPTDWSVVFAENGNSAETILASLADAVSSTAEAETEAYADSTADASVQAGDWKTAIYVDGLAWNRFHVEVQKDILARYRSKVESITSEYSIEFVDEKWAENRQDRKSGYCHKKRQRNLFMGSQAVFLFR